VKQHLGRQAGVQKVEMSLLDGRVDVIPTEDGQVDPAQLLKAMDDSGLTVAELNVTARGRIRRVSPDSLALQGGPNQSFAIAPNELSKGLEPLADSQTVVTVRGQLYKKLERQEKADAYSAPLKLVILEVKGKE
jgi:hypothetical protein